MNFPWINFVAANWQELQLKIVEQFYLVGLALAIAILLGIPLGILAKRWQKLGSMVLAITQVVQTIPGLALLAFLLPFFGIGAKPAIIALALYALLPIVRNTQVGFSNIPTESLEAAKALGFTHWQQLHMVELPLAMPMIVAGIRTATTVTMGIATLAAFIGAGGLGDFINRGLALNNNNYLLLGAIPVALLALLLDFIIGQIELLLRRGAQQYPRKRFWWLMVTIGLLIGLLSVTGSKLFGTDFNRQTTIRIGTKNFTEQVILGEMLAQLIEAKTPLKVARYFNLGTTDILQRALRSGQIDIYPEYTGTAYLTVLHLPYYGTSAAEIYQQVKADYLKKFDIIWLSPFGFANNQAIAVREAFAKRYRINTISDLRPLATKLVIGAPPEFIQRADGLPGLTKKYHIKFADIKELTPALMYAAIYNNQVNVIVAFSTDGRILRYHLKLLRDDKGLFPPYDCAPLIRQATLRAHPELKKVLQSLNNSIDDQTMQQLNAEVDLQKHSPAEVAHGFLIKRGLL